MYTCYKFHLDFCDLLDNLDTMQVLTRRIVQETELFIILIEIQS